MKSTKEIRRLNLIDLLEKKYAGNQTNLAADLGQQSSVISRAVNNQAVDHRGIGIKFARNIEQKLGLPMNWMDNEHNESQVNLEDSSSHELHENLNYNAVDFAVLGIIEFSNAYSNTMTTQESRQKAFKYLYKAWFNEEIRKQGTMSLLELFF